METDNDVIIEAWNTVPFDKFARFEHLLIDGLAAHGREGLEPAHHRYTTDKSVRDRMVAKGWVPEGDGANLVAMCAPQP